MSARCLTALLLASTLHSVRPMHSQDPTYTRKTLRAMQLHAKSTQDYQTLQEHFRTEAERFRKESVQEEEQIKRELDRPNMVSKYPTPLGRARQLREYYADRSRQCTALEAEYGKKAASSLASVQTAARTPEH